MAGRSKDKEEQERVDKTLNSLKSYAEACFTDKPANLYEFSRDFFEELCKERKPSIASSYASGRDCYRLKSASSVFSAFSSMSLLANKERSGFRHETLFSTYNYDDILNTGIVEFVKTPAQLKTLKELLKRVNTFDDLNENETLIDEMMTMFIMRPYAAGETILVEEEELKFFYVVQDGELRSYKFNRKTKESEFKEIYLSGSCFGQEALLHANVSKYTVRAILHGTLWMIENRQYREIEFKYRHKEREMFEYIIATVDILKNLNDEDRDQVVDSFQMNFYEPNDVVVRDSSDTRGIYFVEKGCLVLSYYDEDELNYVEVSQVNKGQYFGEITLLNPEQKNIFKVVALEPTIVAFLDADKYHRFMAGTAYTTLLGHASEIKAQFKEIVGKTIEDAIKIKHG